MKTNPGVWPTMITPFTPDGRAIDLSVIPAIVDFFIESGCEGLFAVCQSSEMFFLTLAERVALAQAVQTAAAGRVPVIASGHISDDVDLAWEELAAIAGTGVHAVILVDNRLAPPDGDDALWHRNLETLVARLPQALPLGMYECPYPYRRPLSLDTLTRLRDMDRFVFFKDTSCDMAVIRPRLALLAGSGMRLYNANTATLQESLDAGAAGYCGVMANYHPALYAAFMRLYAEGDPHAEALQAFLTLAACLEARCYPISAKYHMQRTGIPLSLASRSRKGECWGYAAQAEIDQLILLEKKVEAGMCGG